MEYEHFQSIFVYSGTFKLTRLSKEVFFSIHGYMKVIILKWDHLHPFTVHLKQCCIYWLLVIIWKNLVSLESLLLSCLLHI